MRNTKAVGAAIALVVGLSLTGAGLANGAPTAHQSTTAATAYAPLPLPANSVGNKQVATGAIDTRTLKDKSIGGWDVLDNTLPWSKMGSDFRTNINNTVAKADAAKTKADAADAKATQALAKPDKDSLTGAYYSVAFYDVGDTNAGAIATVACKSATDTAISGGAQTVGLDATANSRNTPVNSSFPGRMDWSTNTPKPGNLSGWVVQFGGNAGAVSDKAPEKVKVWALCVPGLDIPVVETYTQSADN